MEQRYLNALLLLLVGAYLFWRFFVKPTLEKADRVQVPREIAYKKKKRFRFGVLLCSVLALVVYFYGLSRFLALFFLLGAAFCQYKACQIRVTNFLADPERAFPDQSK